ncbi:MAG: tetratricopeptide repeat protein [Saprospirales bacterium]|nr:tetratricopeptide repeat protein [Saprospirales bacterium]
MQNEIMQTVRYALDQQHFSQALQAAKQAVEANPQDPDAQLLYGDVFLEMENASKAIEHYQQAAALQPACAPAFFKLGNAYELLEDDQAALGQYQTVRRLDPANAQYKGRHGKLLYRKGAAAGNPNFTAEGLRLMEQALEAGATDETVREQLALACFDNAMTIWHPHPENPGEMVATEPAHLHHTRQQLARIRQLTDGSNLAITARLAEFEQHLGELEKREFTGYKYILKAPAIVGGLFLLFGFYVFGIALLAMAALYYFSQIRPVYLSNRQMLRNNQRPPFIIRRLDAMSEDLSNIWFFGSLTDIFFMRFMFRFVFGAIRYSMVILMLPYEIVKGFMVNYQVMA